MSHASQTASEHGAPAIGAPGVASQRAKLGVGAVVAGAQGYDAQVQRLVPGGYRAKGGGAGSAKASDASGGTDHAAAPDVSKAPEAQRSRRRGRGRSTGGRRRAGGPRRRARRAAPCTRERLGRSGGLRLGAGSGCRQRRSARGRRRHEHLASCRWRDRGARHRLGPCQLRRWQRVPPGGREGPSRTAARRARSSRARVGRRARDPHERSGARGCTPRELGRAPRLVTSLRRAASLGSSLGSAPGTQPAAPDVTMAAQFRLNRDARLAQTFGEVSAIAVLQARRVAEALGHSAVASAIAARLAGQPVPRWSTPSTSRAPRATRRPGRA